MLGSSHGAQASSAGALEAYRAHGLFTRWPIHCIATDGAARGLLPTQRALRELGPRLARGCLVHVHADTQHGFWRDALFMAAAVAARCGLIVHLRGAARPHADEGDALEHIGRALLRLLFERAACVVVPYEGLRRWTASVAPRARVVSIPDPVPPAALPAALAGNRVLFLGGPDPANGLFELLEALSLVRAAVPDVRLVCAGSGDPARAARFAAELGVADAVRFTGAVGPSGRRTLIENAALLALPSHAQGMPMDLLDAMAAGVPVIAARADGIAEVVVDGVSGFLVPSGDVSALARRLRSLLLDRALAARVGAAGRATVRLRFSPQRALARLEALYGELGLRCIGEGEPLAREPRKAA